MIVQEAPPTLILEAFEGLLKFVGAPAATALGFIWLFRKMLVPKANGKDTEQIKQHLDMALTRHFDQLRRDLETKIEKGMDNHVTAYLWRAELERPDRRERR